jgi:DNA polymerase III epsilon subunit-like protein
MDLETSGLFPEEGAEIVQIGARALNYYDYSLHESGTFNLLLKPMNPDAASARAIEVIGEDVWKEALENGIHPKVGLRKFVEYIESVNPSGKGWSSPIFVGFNCTSFDIPFLKYWLKDYKLMKGSEWPWSSTIVDVMSQMLDLFVHDDLKNRKLDTFADMFGISRTTAQHDALEDVNITAEMFVRYRQMMKLVRSRLQIKNENTATATT